MMRSDCGSQVCVADDVRLGAHVRLAPFVNLYGCVIGDDTRIGAFVEIQRDARIGQRCKISSHTFICSGVVIEDEVFVGQGVIFINDRRRPRPTGGSNRRCFAAELRSAAVRLSCAGSKSARTRSSGPEHWLLATFRRAPRSWEFRRAQPYSQVGRGEIMAIKFVDLAAQNYEVQSALQPLIANLHATPLMSADRRSPPSSKPSRPFSA